VSFYKQTVRDIDLKNKRVLLRVDYNVPIKDGKVTSDYRIEQSIPTLKYLIEQGCKIVLISHLGRPDGRRDEKFSLKPAVAALEKLIDKKVDFQEDCLGPEVEKAVSELKSGELLMLENLRFYSEEESDDNEFAKKLASYGDVFVQDAFGVVHRAHASTHAMTKHLPSVAGLLLEKEVTTIVELMQNPKKPLVAILGGAKISEKIRVIERFMKIADVICIGGAMANTFLLAEGIDIGDSLVEKDDVKLAKEIMEKARDESKKRPFVFYLPQDGVVATSLDGPKETRIVEWDSCVISDIESYPKQPGRFASQLKSGEMILDVGPISGAFIAGTLQLASSVIWNGTLGVTETKGLNSDPIGPFAHGTELVVESMMGPYGNRPFTFVGGGDTVSFVENRGLTKAFNHVSTGGGASLELMEGKKLPGVDALKDKKT